QALKLRQWQPKYVLKRALEGLLPENIINRRKQAFMAPVGQWLRHGMSGFARRVVFESRLRQHELFRYDAIESLFDAHLGGKADNGVQIWTLMNLSAWYDHWMN